MKKLIIFLMIFMLLFMSIPSSVFAAFGAVNLGPTSDLDGDINVPTGSGYYINEVLLAVGDITDALNVTMTNVGATAINASLIPDSADDTDLGSATYEWQSIYVGTAGKIYLGLSQEVALEVTDANTLAITASDNVDFSGGLDVTGGIIVGANIVSDTADTDNLGATDAEWANIYVGTAGKLYFGLTQEVALELADANTLNITASAGVDIVEGLEVGADILSDTADTDSLGSATLEWLNVYIGDNGKLFFGIAQDATIHRSAANTMTLTASSGVVTSAGLTVTGDLIPAAASSHALGSATNEWTDIYLDDTGYVYFGIAQDANIQRNAANELTLTATSGVSISNGLTVGGTLAMGANDITLTGTIGRDADNFLGWAVDDSLAIEIANVAHAIVSISDGAGDNDKLVTQGYVDDAAGTANNWMVHFMDVDAASTTYVHAAIAGNEASQDVSTEITNPDYGRIITVTTTNNSTPEGNVTITGTLANGTTGQTDAITISAGATASGVKAFVTVTNINIPAGVDAGDTCAIGIGDVMGLPNAISAEADIYMKTVDGVEEFGEISGNGNTTNNTLDCATIVQNEDITLYYHN